MCAKSRRRFHEEVMFYVRSVLRVYLQQSERKEPIMFGNILQRKHVFRRVSLTAFSRANFCNFGLHHTCDKQSSHRRLAVNGAIPGQCGAVGGRRVGGLLGALHRESPHRRDPRQGT